MRLLCLLTILFATLAVAPQVAAAPVLVVTSGGATRQFTADELRAWPTAATIAVPRDPAYGGAISFRAGFFRSFGAGGALSGACRTDRR